MKTFIVIFILVIGFFYYLFFTTENSKTTEKVNTPAYTLETLEMQNNKESESFISHMTELPVAIPEDQTFDMIKNILKEASGRTYAPNITLNTRINSYLYTIEAKEHFKQELAKAFNLNYDDIDKAYQKNILVWDWVNQFKE